ncbi:MAG: alkaline phosphatase family protein [Saprospiraceae bacterium]|nr:alkaline phosphatase family protein [Saprospiraceae bacterium]
MKINVVLILLFLPLSLIAQLVSGPMVGHVTYQEATVWVQCKESSKVQLRYWPVDQIKMAKTTMTAVTMAEHAFTAHLVAGELTPGTTYQYEIWVNGKVVKGNHEQSFKTPAVWRYRGDAPDFDFVAGSCFYINEETFDRPGKPYGGDYKILQAIHKDQPDFMVWLGDNAYLRDADWDSRSGVYHRYSHSRAVKELQPLIANTPQYAIWDDHDYGPNDSDRSYYGKEWTRAAFQDFWANPVYGAGDTEGITGAFSHSDADFFLMDNRWYRSPQSPSGEILGEKQLNWLIESLRYSNATFKFVCIGGQTLSDARVFENYAIYVSERQKLLNAIDQYAIKGVIFLTGDRHHSELTSWTSPSGIKVYDITSSALTSSTSAHPEEPNTGRVEGSMVGVRNYAQIKISGAKDNRKLSLSFKDLDGKIIYTNTIEP